MKYSSIEITRTLAKPVVSKVWGGPPWKGPLVGEGAAGYSGKVIHILKLN
jgi:hypothetical protein